MRTALCNTFFRLFGHHACCTVPSWTYNIGQRWDTYDVAPWNLGNIIWRAKTWVRDGMAEPGEESVAAHNRRIEIERHEAGEREADAVLAWVFGSPDGPREWDDLA